MHESAMKYGRVFFEKYCDGDYSGKIIVDVGSQDVNGSLREFCPNGASYIGVDFVEGRGVDVVITDPYHFPFESESVDVVVCSSVFEHSEFFWLLFLECMRIVKATGLIYLNVPSNGMVHRYPIDSWRFYPDSGLALVNWSKYNNYDALLLESFLGEKQGPIAGEGMWNDFVAVILKDKNFAQKYTKRIQDSSGVFHCGYNSNKECAVPSYSNSPDHSLIVEQQDVIERLSESACLQDNELVDLNEKLRDREHQLNKLAKEIEALKRTNEKIFVEMSALFDSQYLCLKDPLSVLEREDMRASLGVKLSRSKFFKALWRSFPLSIQHKEFIKGLIIKKNDKAEDAVHDIPVIEFDCTREGYVEYKVNLAIKPMVKLIAFYLPQFHPFPENDEWWGKGFTEWFNVGKAGRNYVGHYQPHCPIHNGYYDLRIPSVMEEQASLAKQYGVHGFSYYFYWFAGKILMDTPLEMMLENSKVDIPFCLTWANENWTRRWDGQDSDVLIAQNHSSEDSIAFIRHLVKYFNDSRYIKIDGKPVLIIYRASIIPNMSSISRLWREEVKNHGFSDLYLICAQSFGICGPEEFDFDASVEFPPHTTKSHEISNQLEITNPDFKGCIFSYDQVVAASVREKEPDYKLFRTPMLSWDNTARKQDHSHMFHGFSLMRYKQWLSAVCSNVSLSQKYGEQEKLVFVNAWNEWAEGTHLEPDRKYGYGYLQATYDVLSNYDEDLNGSNVGRKFVRSSKYAVILHIHYVELWYEIKGYLKSLEVLGFDLFVTTTNKDAVSLVLADYPDSFVEIHENRGRDVFPFTKIMDRIREYGYSAVCKLHTKRSVYRLDGDNLRGDLLRSLLGDEAVIRNIVARFESNSSLGIVVPKDYLVMHTDWNMKYNRATVLMACKTLEVDFDYDVFPAGSMFWFRPDALGDLSRFTSSDFDVERGLVDGTLPHAIERVFCSLAKKSGYTVEVC